MPVSAWMASSRIQLVERVDDDPADTGLDRHAELPHGLVVAVEDEPFGGHPGMQGDMEFAARRHIEVHTLLVGQLRHRRAEERLRGVGDAVAEDRHGVPAAIAQMLLVVDEQRRAELGGEVDDVAAADVEAPVDDVGRVGQEAEGKRLHDGAYIDSGALTPSRSRPTPRPMRVASTSHMRAWRTGSSMSSRRIGQSCQNPWRAGRALAGPRRDLVRRPVLRRPYDDVGELGQRPQERELAGVGEHGEVHVGQRRTGDPPFLRLPGQGVHPGVGVLHVVDGVLARLGDEDVDVDRLRRVDRLEEEREPGDVGTGPARRGRGLRSSSPPASTGGPLPRRAPG